MKKTFLFLFLVAGMFTAHGQCDGAGFQLTVQGPGLHVAQETIEHPNGDLYMAGFSNGFSNDHDLLLVRMTTGGAVVWAKRYHLSGHDGGSSIALACGPSGALYIAASMDGLAFNGAGEDGSLLKLDADGGVLWARRVVQLPYYAHVRAVAESINGDVVVTGSSNSFGAGNADAFCARFSADGTLQWMNAYGWSGQDHLVDVHAYPDGSFTALSTSMGTGGVRKGVVARFAANGDPLSCRLHGGTQFDIYNRGCRNEDGTYLYVGSTQSFGAGGMDVLVTLGDSAGNVSWSAAYGAMGDQDGLNAVGDGAGGWFVVAREGAQQAVRVFHIDPLGMLLSTRSIDDLTLAQYSRWNEPLLRSADGGLLLSAATASGTGIALRRMDPCAQSGCGSTELQWIRTPVQLGVQDIPLPISAVSTAVSPMAVTTTDITTELGQAIMLEPCAECGIAVSVQDIVACAGEEVSITAVVTGADGAPLTWSWDLGDGSSSAQEGGLVHTYAVPGQYVLELGLEQSGGCSVLQSALVEVVGPTSVDLGPDLSACADVLLELAVDAPSGASVQWSTGETTNVIQIATSGEYWVTSTLDGCSTSDTLLVDLVAPPVFDLGPDTLLCPGGMLVLSTGISGQVHVWQDGSGAEVFNVVEAGTYWVEVGEGCVTEDVVVVALVALPGLDLGPDQVLCEGTELLLASPMGDWQSLWSDGSTGPTLVVDTAGFYWLAVQADGCSVSDTLEVDALSPPQVMLDPDTVSCNGMVVELEALTTDAAVFLWSTDASVEMIVAEASGTYWLEVQNICGTDRDSIEVVIVPPIDLELGPDLLLCEPIAHLLQSGQSAEHSTWQDGSQGEEFLVTGPGTYSVTVDIEGCIATDALDIAMTSMPDLEVSDDTLLCEAEPVWLQASASEGSTVEWPDGSTGATHLAPDAGTWVVSATNVCGTVVDSIRVMHAPPFPYLTDQRVCPGASAFVSAPADVQQVQWSTGGVNASVVLPIGAYDYLMVDASGCERTGSFTVLVDPEEDGRQFVPNVFTPDGDGTNDVFQVVGAERDGFSLEIYDRWGLLLFEASSGRMVWDGRANGGEVPEGVYIYVVKYQARCGDRGLVARMGHVTLLR